MPLRERSFFGWAEIIAREQDQPLNKIVHAIGSAIIDGGLPAMLSDEPRMRNCLVMIVAAANQGMFEYSHPQIKNTLYDIMITAEDMARWLDVTGLAPAKTPTRDEAVIALIAKHGKAPGRGGIRHSTFAEEVRKVCGESRYAGGFSDDAIKKAISRLRS
jgi:hypothetical protein